MVLNNLTRLFLKLEIEKVLFGKKEIKYFLCSTV